MTIIGAYLGAKTWQAWTASDAGVALTELKNYGINTIFSEADTYDDDMIAGVHDMGMRFMGGLKCFLDNDAVEQHPELHPITVDGEPRPQMNWYIGVTPTYELYAQRRLDALEGMVMNHQLDGVWLDFIRWSLHWEQELRDDTPPPLESSFDSHTLTRFADYADLAMPTGTTQEQVNWILKHHLDTWINFRCQVITDFVAQAKRIMNNHAPGIPMGIDCVPAIKADRERLLGQRLPDLAQYADYLSPMLYHHILGKSPTWITDALDEFAGDTSASLLPFLQVDSLKGDDEGFPVHEWETILKLTLDHEKTVGLIVFVGDRLNKNMRGQILKSVLM